MGQRHLQELSDRKRFLTYLKYEYWKKNKKKQKKKNKEKLTPGLEPSSVRFGGQ